MTTDELKCLDRSDGNCQGEPKRRESLSRNGQMRIRCDFHWQKRLEFQDRIESKYPDSPIAPDWFDPTYAGESWDGE